MRHLTIALVVGLLLLMCHDSAGQEPRGDLPASLKRLHRIRSAWTSARVEWVLESSATAPTPRFYEAQIAGPDKLVIDYGDEEGMISRYADGEPQPYGFGPFYTLQLGGDVWHYGEGRIDAHLATDVPSKAAVDFRTLGLSPSRHCGGLNDALGQNLSRFDDDVKYRARRENGMEIVTASAGDYTVTWKIDPKSGGLPLSVTTDRAGEVESRSLSTPRKFGDAWCPGRVEYYRSSYANGLKPCEVIEVQSVEPNPTDIPEHLTPEYIHIDTGVVVDVSKGLGSKTSEMRKWDGEKAASLEEFAEQFRQGKIHDGPYYTANRARVEAMVELHRAHESQANGVPPATPPETTAGADVEPPRLEKLTGWEAYTARFIDKYRLDQSQTQKAIQILRQCQDLARKHIARNEKAFETLDQADRSDEAESKRKALLKPLDDIFESQLKPRLNALPTRHQKRQVAPPSRRESPEEP